MSPTFRLLTYLLPLILLQACASSQPRKVGRSPSHATPDQPAAKSRAVSPSQTGSPTTQKIINQATELTNQGQLEAAAQTLERGLRIAPKDATLWSRLAAIRLQQKQYDQAQSMAQKSNTLAGTNMTIIQKNNTIIEAAQRNR